MTQTEALKLALEAFDDRSSLMKWQKARGAIQEALAQPEQKDEKGRPMTYWGGLAQPEQEPVAWMYSDAKGRSVLVGTNIAPYQDAIPLYTSTPHRKPLTDEEIQELFGVGKVDATFTQFVRAIESAHGIKE